MKRLPEELESVGSGVEAASAAGAALPASMDAALAEAAEGVEGVTETDDEGELAGVTVADGAVMFETGAELATDGLDSGALRGLSSGTVLLLDLRFLLAL